MEGLLQGLQQPQGVPTYTPRGPTGFGSDIIFGSMGRTTDVMKASVNSVGNLRSRSGDYDFGRALNTEGSGFFDTILNLGKQVLPTLGKLFTSTPVGQFAKKLLPKIPDILRGAANNGDYEEIIEQLLELTRDPEIKSMIAELTNRGHTTTTRF